MMADVKVSKRILTVGLACLDVVHVVSSYPVEDTDQRSLDQYSSLGGNAANSAVVLNNLGQRCDYFGTLANNTLETSLLVQKFVEKGIDVSNCCYMDNCICPNSSVIVNKQSGSRTIIHTNKNLPELVPNQFDQYLRKRNPYDWIHFEGRNLENVKKMIEHLRECRVRTKISVEVEKVGRNFEQLIPYGDVVFISKDVAQYHGAKTKMDTMDLFKDKLRPSAQLVCAWGSEGASGLDCDGKVLSSPSYPPDGGIKDTLGAGDCFNAAVIGVLSHGKSLTDALSIGCQVAGKKVGQIGFDGLGELFQQLLSDCR